MFNYQTSFDELNHQDENHPLIGENATLQLHFDGGTDPLNSSLNATTSRTARNEHFAALIRQKIRREYPLKYVLFTIVSLVGLNMLSICLERAQNNRFDFNDLTLISFRSLDGLVLAAAAINILFCMLNLITVFCRRYLLIQVTSILHLSAFFTSFILLIVINIIVLVFQLLDEQGKFNYAETIKRVVMITSGALISILQLIYFVVIQFVFFRSVNRTTPTY